MLPPTHTHTGSFALMAVFCCLKSDVHLMNVTSVYSCHAILLSLLKASFILLTLHYTIGVYFDNQIYASSLLANSTIQSCGT
jgi:hypothetical protein